MLAVIYARASPGEHSRRSVPEQLRLGRQKARELAGGRPLAIREFQDPETSGDIPPADRPGFAQAIAAARAEQAAYFVCLDPDRFSRDVYQALGAADDIDRTGARLVFVLHEYDMSPEGRMFFTFRVAIAEYEKHKIRERTQRGIRAKLARGELPYAPRPYGYRFNPATDALEVLPDQAAWLRRIFRWVLEERLGPQGIARRLNQLGVPAPRGRWWHRQAVSRILRNPVYRGQLVVNKSNQSGMRSNRHRPPGQRIPRRPRPASEWVLLPAPAIVDAGAWHRAQAVLAELAERRGRRGGTGEQAPTPYLLTGLCICGHCGRRCHGFSAGRRRYYVCSGRYPARTAAGADRPRDQRCTLPHLRREPIEQYVCAAVGAWLRDESAYAAAWEEARTASGPESDRAAAVDRLRRALSELEGEWDRRLEAFHKGWVRDPQRSRAELQALSRRAEVLRRQITALAPRPDLAGSAPPGRCPAGAQGGDLEPAPEYPTAAARLQHLGAEEWQMAIHLLVAQVVLRADGPPVVRFRQEQQSPGGSP